MIQMKTIALTGLLAGAALLTGCRTAAGTGSLLGAGAGAAIGRAVGNHNGHAGLGTVAGGVVGGLTGYILGNEIDQDREDRRGTRYRGDPRYEPGYDRYDRGGYYSEPAPRYREYYYVEPPRERVIYRERTYYGPECRPCW